ncbi:uncharacterized protein MKZ38_000594 [Zalerion maritima]|uniref:Uncharacterized protein n=1 Tax=Zalerion maritima TaxID=339359 RepID=A0AAD5RRE5_9PEZI|nr:uncharacterized protein MKZ38_000594 [Zalerion maritima]
MDLLDLSKIEQYRQELRDDETPEPEPLEDKELHDIWQHGNRRRPVPPNLSDNHKANLVGLKHRWIIFATRLGHQDWKSLIKTLSFENKGLGELFMRYLMRRAELDGTSIKYESAIRVNTRKLGGLYKKYAGHPFETSLRDHLRKVARPDFFIYYLNFRWVCDTSAFHIGLDRIDDACLRMFYIWMGCRKHELVYAKPPDITDKVRENNKDSDAYTDVECNKDDYIKPRVKKYWVLYWEDIELWILRDLDGNSGRDRLAMQVLFRWYKGENKKIVPAWYIFIEEQLSVLCPFTHILAKALAEGVIENEGFETRAEPFFATRLNKRAVSITWKKEWLHEPVFRKTVKAETKNSWQGFQDGVLKIPKAADREPQAINNARRSLWEKSDDPITAATFDSRSERLRIQMGLPKKLAQYAQRRGYAESNYRQSVRDQGLRHKANSTIYQEAYHNSRTNAVVQDAFLGRGTQSPYLAIFNHMGLRLNENAPKGIPDEMMRTIGPSTAIRRLEQKMDELQAELREKYGRPSQSVGDDKKRKVFRKIYRDFFAESDKKELQKQLQGIHEPVVERPVVHELPERRKLAAIMGDMDEDLPEEDIVQRKVEAINAMVAYAFVHEPLRRRRPESQDM